MFFSTTRIVLWLIISVCAVLIIKNSKINRKKFISFLAFIFATIIISISGLYPAENLLVNFKSPESVFNYINTGKIDDIIYGQDSCLIVYSKEKNTTGHYIIPKTAKGYKIPSPFTIKKISHKFDKNSLLDVYNVKGTQDYYILGTVHLIEDNCEINIYNGREEKIENHIIRTENTNFIFFYLHDFSDEYYLLINNQKIFISR